MTMPSGGIQVIARTAEILRVLRTVPDGLTPAELGERIGLARSTVHRLLNAMRDEGLVETFGPRGRYRLGPAIHRMADAAWRSGLGGLHPLLEELAQVENRLSRPARRRGRRDVVEDRQYRMIRELKSEFSNLLQEKAAR